MKIETRDFLIAGNRSEVRAIREEGKPTKIGGYAAPFNSQSEDLGGFREVISPGAFLDTIAKDDIRGLVNHETRLVIGRMSAGTLKLWEDNRGLGFENLLPNTSYANDLLESLSRGDITGMSFRFYVPTPTDERWARFNMPQGGQGWIRTILRATLIEVSPVTFPAYSGSEVGMRSAGNEAPEGLARAIAAEATRSKVRDRDIRLAELS